MPKSSVKPNAPKPEVKVNPKAPKPGETYVDKVGKEYKYQPPKKWGGKSDKQGNYPTKGTDKWGPLTTHKGKHAPHYDIQHPDGSHTPVYPKTNVKIK